MAGLVVSYQRSTFDKPGEKIDDTTELKLKGEKIEVCQPWWAKIRKGLASFFWNFSEW